MSNIWEKRYRKTNKTAYELGKELNIGEEKVKEIIKGEREVPTADVDRVYEAFTTNTTDKPSEVERTFIEQYFKEHNIKDLKKEFNYGTLLELATALNVSTATLNRLRNEDIKDVSTKTLVKIYDFFQDGFNKKPSLRKKQIISKKRNRKQCPVMIKYDELSDEIKEWYKNVDLKQLRKNQHITGFEMCERLGFNRSYYSVYCRYENKRINVGHTSNWAMVKQLYNYYHGLELFDVYNRKHDTVYTPMLKCEPKESVNIDIETPIIDGKKLIDNLKAQQEIEKSNANKNDDAIDAIRYYVENKKEEPKSTISPNAVEYVTIEAYTALQKEVERYRYLIDKLIEKDNEN